MAIRKTIHYCWFGKGEKPEILLKCMASWKQHCPDYEIIEWNESNFDINYCEFTKQAYEQKKYAFVSDVARLWIVYHHGGHYLDTDVELKQSLDVFAEYDGWFASETMRHLNTGMGFGARENSPMIKAMLDFYQDQNFNSQVCITVNTAALKERFPDLGYFDQTSVYRNCLFLGFTEYGRYANHLCAGSWLGEEHMKKRLQELEMPKKPSRWAVFKWRFAMKIRRPKLVKYLETHPNFFTRILYFLMFDFIDCGLWICMRGAFKRIIRLFKKSK